MLQDLLSLNLFAFLLIFARVGTAMALMTGFSASYVPNRIRLGIALGVAFVVTPVLAADLPVLPESVPALALLIGGEVVIGALMGTLSRIIIGGLQTAGTLIAYSASMANALIQDPIAEQQSSTVSGFLVTSAVVLIFIADLHHLMIRSVIDSYTLFVPGGGLPAGDLAQMVTRLVAEAFAIGLQMASPFIIVALTYYIGLGLLGRLMPQLQVFFFGLPFQVSVQIWVLSVTFAGILMVFMRHFTDTYGRFIGGF